MVVAHDIDFRGYNIAVYSFVGEGGYKEYHGLVAHCFLPLRTEREKAIDEMMKCTLGVMNKETQRRLFEDLYDAGYRKDLSLVE